MGELGALFFVQTERARERGVVGGTVIRLAQMGEESVAEFHQLDAGQTRVRAARGAGFCGWQNETDPFHSSR